MSSKKSPGAFRTISEAADELGVASHVLRFWETKFTQIRPMKLNGGRRYYRPEDMEIIRQINELLHQKGFTIKGAQAFLKKSFPLPEEPPPPPQPSRLDFVSRAAIELVIDELRELQIMLKTS